MPIAKRNRHICQPMHWALRIRSRATPRILHISPIVCVWIDSARRGAKLVTLATCVPKPSDFFVAAKANSISRRKSMYF